MARTRRTHDRRKNYGEKYHGGHYGGNYADTDDEIIKKIIRFIVLLLVVYILVQWIRHDPRPTQTAPQFPQFPQFPPNYLQGMRHPYFHGGYGSCGSCNVPNNYGFQFPGVFPGAFGGRSTPIPMCGSFTPEPGSERIM